jgi:hypothetical protein
VTAEGLRAKGRRRTGDTPGRRQTRVVTSGWKSIRNASTRTSRTRLTPSQVRHPLLRSAFGCAAPSSVTTPHLEPWTTPQTGGKPERSCVPIGNTVGRGRMVASGPTAIVRLLGTGLPTGAGRCKSLSLAWCFPGCFHLRLVGRTVAIEMDANLRCDLVPTVRI